MRISLSEMAVLESSPQGVHPAHLELWTRCQALFL